MKKSRKVFLLALLSLFLLAGCNRQGGVTEVIRLPGNEPIAVVPDSHLEEDQYDPKIYEADPNAPVVEIPEESVPLASAYVDVTDGVSEREAEAIAIHHAGLRNDEVNYLHSRLVEDAEPVCYHIEFRSSGIPYKFRISAEDGRILLYEKG